MTPTVTPTTTANVTLTTATRIDAWIATNTRDSTSRPNSSVPNQCWPLGGCNAFGTSTLLTPNGVIQLAATATKTTTTRTAALTTVMALRSSSRHDATRVDCAVVVVMPAGSSDRRPRTARPRRG